MPERMTAEEFIKIMSNYSKDYLEKDGNFIKVVERLFGDSYLYEEPIDEIEIDMEEKLNIGTIIRYNGDNYSITGYDSIGYNVKVINPSDDNYATHISYKALFEIIEICEKELNLCEILKGHEGETFYNPLLGNIKYKSSDDGLVFFSYGNSVVDIPYTGLDNDGNMAVFPSENQRDWNKWDEENNEKTPKTWSELKKAGKVVECHAQIQGIWGNKLYDGTKNESSIEKSALALLKIHQLIEFGYGGNVSREAWNDEGYGAWCILYNYKTKKFEIQHSVSLIQLIAFQTLKQAEEFLSYPENVQLLEDYYMI